MALRSGSEGRKRGEYKGPHHHVSDRQLETFLRSDFVGGNYCCDVFVTDVLRVDKQFANKFSSDLHILLAAVFVKKSCCMKTLIGILSHDRLSISYSEYKVKGYHSIRQRHVSTCVQLQRLRLPVYLIAEYELQNTDSDHHATEVCLNRCRCTEAMHL